MFQHVSNSLMEEGDFIGDRTAIHEGKSVCKCCCDMCRLVGELIVGV